MKLDDSSSMTLEEYQEAAMSFRLPQADEVYAQLNLVGELGELFGKIAKARRDGLPVDAEEFRLRLMKEGGDVLWQLTAVLSDLGIDLAEAASCNIEKLTDRAARFMLQGSGDNR